MIGAGFLYYGAVAVNDDFVTKLGGRGPAPGMMLEIIAIVDAL